MDWTFVIILLAHCLKAIPMSEEFSTDQDQLGLREATKMHFSSTSICSMLDNQVHMPSNLNLQLGRQIITNSKRLIFVLAAGTTAASPLQFQ